ncbi:hypothetical protein D9758_005254 [Tetrapyrgos nigripes]|uniref:Cation/H+ exchanger transmembrane domain-containing protein n=1 Tax=Tetrapyrgos nigripes TaxID=182062 RepID=A0A8H5GWU8_9AGAR|nr:hypothetical protein D9758_005254 [Tetrapyrgos nigripes]
MVFVTGTLVGVFASSFFTDVIGVHAIFGAFLFGLIVPREGGLAVAMMEKLEDVVGSIFLPLYFTLSGLSTDLGLLNTGLTWGYTIAICTLAFSGKFGECTLSAKYVAGFNWREASAIGSLMSCKGLVELIVLNVGLQAHILTPRPPHLRVRASKTGANFGNVADGAGGGAATHKPKSDGSHDVEDPTNVKGGGGRMKKTLGLRKGLTNIRSKTRASFRRPGGDENSDSDSQGSGVDGEGKGGNGNGATQPWTERIQHGRET